MGEQGRRRRIEIGTAPKHLNNLRGYSAVWRAAHPVGRSRLPCLSRGNYGPSLRLIRIRVLTYAYAMKKLSSYCRNSKISSKVYLYMQL